jgi:hypothetical protein
MAARLLIVLAAVVLLRLPFLDQAIHGDDVYYLAIARNALVDPLHPMQMGYTFQGDRVSMAGHPHPPLNAYALAALLWLLGDVRESLFHLAYLLFSLMAAAAMYSLARRFTDRPLLAAALFLAAPAFVVNGNSLESDLPFLAFWMAGFAFYFAGRRGLAAGSLAVAALAAYQAVFAAPILAHDAWHRRRREPAAWLAVMAPVLSIAAWQILQRGASGEAPAAVLAGYLQTYDLLALAKKGNSALALTGHLGWIVLPAAALCAPRVLLGCAPAALALGFALPGYVWWQRALLAVSLASGLALIVRWTLSLWKKRTEDSGWLAAWGLAFFGGAVLVFFAGSARYLLPLAPAVILLVVRQSKRSRLLWGAAAVNLCVGLLLASANYEHAEKYRTTAREIEPLLGERRVWTNAEWGLRYYLERVGAEPLERDQPVYPGAVVITSEAAGVFPYSASGGDRRDVLRTELRNTVPVRLFGLDTRSGYSSSALGILPFDLGWGRLDAVTAAVIGLAEPRLSYLRMSDPSAAAQLLSGFHEVEDNAWRWMGGEGVALLKAPGNVQRFDLRFVIPEAAPARRVTVAIDGISIANQAYPAPGGYALSVPLAAGGPVRRAVVTVDRTFQAPGDERRLGIIVQELGLR